MEQGNQCFIVKCTGASKPHGHFYLKISQQGIFSSQCAGVLQSTGLRVLLREESDFLQWQLFVLACM